MIDNCEQVSNLTESLTDKSLVVAFGSKSGTILFPTFESSESLKKSRGHQFSRNPVISTKSRFPLVINPLALMTNLCRFVNVALVEILFARHLFSL